MLGRGVDQILPHPGNPTLYERNVRDARTYVDLAIRANGNIPLPVDWSWPWGDALELLRSAGCDARIINLETSITTSDDFLPGKAVHYRMNPANAEALTQVRPDVCVLANNHVLDFGRRGLLETLDVLSAADFPAAGAGRSWSLPSVRRPAASRSSGGRQRTLRASMWLPRSAMRPPMSCVTRCESCGGLVTSQSCQHTGEATGATASQPTFAHRLIDGGVDLVHGHSSHHPRPLEVYREKLILYGCGDLIDDYEGIRGHDQYRHDLRLLYLPRLDPTSGKLVELHMAPLQARQMRLHGASHRDRRSLRTVLDKVSRHFGSRIDLGSDGLLRLRRPS